jgi:hypothetical protein
LLKLLLRDRLGLERSPLVDAQRDAFASLFAAHADRPDGHDVVALWRYHSASAVQDFLASLDRSAG